MSDVTPEELEAEAEVMRSMAENVRQGFIEAFRDESGMICYRMTEAGIRHVENMGTLS